jgi:hypothetical protein
VHVGVCAILFEVAESASLKDKRQVVRSIKDRVRRRFNVSIAEVGELDSRTLAEIGLACVSNDVRHLNSILTKASEYIEDEFPISVRDVTLELL